MISSWVCSQQVGEVTITLATLEGSHSMKQS